MDENTLDEEFVKEQIDKADKIINNLLGEHCLYLAFFDIEDGRLDSFIDSLSNAQNWLRQAGIDYSEYVASKDN